MSNANLINSVSDAQKIAMFNEICLSKQNEVTGILKANGFEFSRGRKASSDYEAIDTKIVEVLAKYPDGLKVSIAKFFVCEQEGNNDLTDLQFNSRMVALTNKGKIEKCENKRGFYRAV